MEEGLVIPMTNNIVTSDWSDFGHREIEMAKELLSHIKEIDSYGKVEVMFNFNSGYVFLCDADYKVWMMNGDKLEQWFTCPICGHEGFKEDMEHAEDDEECTEYLKEIGVIEEDEETLGD